MLSCCDADGEILSVPEFFAVGKTFRALFWCAVKGGGHCQFLNISVRFIYAGFPAIGFHKSLDTTLFLPCYITFLEEIFQIEAHFIQILLKLIQLLISKTGKKRIFHLLKYLFAYLHNRLPPWE